MSDEEGGKKSGYRLEYAKSARSKCTGEPISRPLRRVSCNPLLTAIHASLSRHRTQAVRIFLIVMVVHYCSRLSRCKGTKIEKGELRFGSLVDFKGNTNL